jgi:hypothetical protein
MNQNFYFDIKNFTFTEKKIIQTSNVSINLHIDIASDEKQKDNVVFTKKPFFVSGDFQRYKKGYTPNSELNTKEYIWLTFLGKNFEITELEKLEFIDVENNVRVYYFKYQPRVLIYRKSEDYFLEYDFFTKNAYFYPFPSAKVLIPIIVYSDYYDKSFNLIKLNDYFNKNLKIKDKGVCGSKIQLLESLINSSDDINYDDLKTSLITKLKTLNKNMLIIGIIFLILIMQFVIFIILHYIDK